MGLTLIEAAKSEMDPQRNAVISELAMGEFLGMIPFRDIDNAGLFYEQEGDLPMVGFRGINEAATASYGVLNPQSEALKIMSSDIDIDVATLDWHGDGRRAEQIQMKVKSMRKTVEDLIFNGDQDVNPRQFDGLKKRIVIGSSQAISQGTAACSLGKVDEMIDAVDADAPDKILVMSRAMKRKFTKASRTSTLSGILVPEQDRFGRKAMFYQDIPIVTVDVNAANQPILPFTEASSTTSIYCISFGDTLSTALQGRCRGEYGVSIRQLGEVDDAPVDRTRIEWYVGMAILNGRSVARLHGITDVDIVA
jgi:hypothetical protein